ncbi:hypothetical protein AYM40_09885 [Paraburkholderia phytofirmans OLGA172]|uniref:Uncharacterized protein n=1 Tax=Paraburkholderia phytofirmans OLGA172 TaxID=1417228 RepID=A0A167VYA2_9BURK|nr:hypothetical protein AYM40_09885 [Paraburkholderia phytofirmans OLGA172]
MNARILPKQNCAEQKPAIGTDYISAVRELHRMNRIYDSLRSMNKVLVYALQRISAFRYSSGLYALGVSI